MDSEQASRLFRNIRIIKELGAGAAGTVFLATPDEPGAVPRREPGDLVAIKVYHDDILSEPHQLERIKREASIGLTFKNAHLVSIIDAHLDPGQHPALVMEYIDGPPLSEWLKSFPQVRDPLLLQIFLGILSGLAGLHQAHIIHRDIKPANILLTTEFEAVLTDFGVAHETSEPRLTTHPEEGKFLGTPRYAAPERLLAPERDPSAQSDLYSVGAVIYELLYEHPVFEGVKSIQELLHEKMNSSPVFYHDKELTPIRKTIGDMCRRLLAAAPTDRPGSAEELLEELGNDSVIVAAQDEQPPLRGYMACALTNLSPEESEAVMFVSHGAAKAAMDFDIYTHQPRTVTHPTHNVLVPKERVYELDRRRVMSADVVFALANRASMGVGMELEIAAAAGVPVVLIHRKEMKVSRMVTGSTLNLLGTVTYETPEQLERGVRKVLRENLAAVRTYHAVHETPSHIDVGGRLRHQRKNLNLSVAQVATRAGVSPRLIELLESEPTWFLNAGLDALQRICRVLSIGVGAAVESPAEGDVARLSAVSKSIMNLHEVAQRDRWSREDVCSLTQDFLAQEKAARGSGQIISLEEWKRRRA